MNNEVFACERSVKEINSFYTQEKERETEREGGSEVGGLGFDI